LLAAAAAVNVFQVSYDIGVRGVVGLWCEFSFAPIFWSLLTGVIHFFASLALRISKRSPKDEVRKPQSTGLKGIWASLVQFLREEWTLSANRTPRKVDNIEVGPVGVGLQLVAGWLAVVHIAFGTAVFAGFALVSTSDAALLLLRYLASGTVCRLIMLFEIGGMRPVQQEAKIFRWIVQHKNSGLVDGMPISTQEEPTGKMN
jgi:hypothetical protein